MSRGRFLKNNENIRKVSSPHGNWVKLAAVKKFLSIAETTKRREPAQLIVGGKYRVGKKISNGAFGQLRWGTQSALHCTLSHFHQSGI